MGFFSEFKTFIQRGNVVDLAVGVVIGGAFGKIVSSFVGDVLMPPIGLLLGGVDFSDIQLVLRAAQGDQPAVAMNVGLFINTILDFVIVAFAIFLLVRGVNRLNTPPAPEVPAEPSEEVKLLREIRDALKNGNQ